MNRRRSLKSIPEINGKAEPYHSVRRQSRGKSGLTQVLQHLSRMAAGDVGDLGAGKHSCNLLNPRATIQIFHAHFSSRAHCFLLYEQVAVGKPGDLRLVSDAKNLVRLRQLFELGADCLADPTADARIYFIEHDGAREL